MGPQTNTSIHRPFDFDHQVLLNLCCTNSRRYVIFNVLLLVCVWSSEFGVCAHIIRILSYLCACALVDVSMLQVGRRQHSTQLYTRHESVMSTFYVNPHCRIFHGNLYSIHIVVSIERKTTEHCQKHNIGMLCSRIIIHSDIHNTSRVCVWHCSID